ncbi:tRNA preQ1(34) S-adenosylmethionine ribosyltransferase-isomerase QueA [Rickettsiella endosymbiont of Miltochrista miniata]|uniref:tRNA preQ1(34) S-adenosylmethionine ribosyltransferase-isomerase QueA n=1 Tax=Rickettsiella endosymbiont of Miltochrista miniata TaxID=3066239 RepID=UPI00313D981D
MLQTQYKLEDFSYELPEKLIAHYPSTQRTDSRLLCLNKSKGDLEHKKFIDILNVIHPGDLLVLNNTQVIPARLFANKTTGGKVEILIERILDKKRLLAQLKSSKPLKLGTKLILENGVSLAISTRVENIFELIFLVEVPSVLELLNKIGHIPLPPYIQRADELFDWERYQTVFASTPGAIAAPTAGLHFDEDLLAQLKAKGVNIAYITLHVGAGTFQPIRSARLEDHHMHNEHVTVSEAVCEQISLAKQNNKRVIAVGTTTVRSLETAALHGQIEPFAGDTRLFIYPGFEFRCIDALITNFHLPQSTLLMLVCAFAGYEKVMHAYRLAIQGGYRFFSYGDAMWIS